MYIKNKILVLVIGLSLLATTNAYATVDTTQLPVGDGKISTQPQKGYVYSCQTVFSANAGGASADGNWIHGNTWNLAEKTSVQGSVSWPKAWFKNESTTNRSLTGNGLPVGSTTGTFPIATTDPAYQIDKNPNTIQSQTVNITLPTNPAVASTATCVPMGAIGRALNGVAIFNALDGRGDDAVAHEMQDVCGGHPERTGEYHYHGPSSCIAGADQPNTLVGYALDGFGIYSRFDANGREYSNADLDECHGITSEIEWSGKKTSMYHYVITQEYPYTLGCFRGTPISSVNTSGSMSGKIDTVTTGQWASTTKNSNTSGQVKITNTQLKYNDTGTDVTALQQMLIDAGYLKLSSTQSTGYFGKQTVAALKKFQKANKLPQTGTFNTTTQTKMSEHVTANNSQNNNNEQKPTMNQNMNMPGGSAAQMGTDSNQKPVFTQNANTQTSSTVQPPMMNQNSTNQQSGKNSQMGPNMNELPPMQAINACSGKTVNASCSFSGMNAEAVSGVCAQVQSTTLACKPANMMNRQ